MADAKISALTGATTPLAGTEVLPIVQNGSTVKVSVANLTAGRAVAMAGGSFTDNLTQSTAAKGVNFTANTPAAGMTSQLLNWYEEGTWVPTLTGSTGNPTGLVFSGGPTGRYVRNGSIVMAYYYFGPITWTGAGTGLFLVSGLPFSGTADVYTPAMISGCTVQPTAASATLNNPNGTVYFQTSAGAFLNWTAAVSGGNLSFKAIYKAS